MSEILTHINDKDKKITYLLNVKEVLQKGTTLLQLPHFKHGLLGASL